MDFLDDLNEAIEYLKELIRRQRERMWDFVMMFFQPRQDRQVIYRDRSYFHERVPGMGDNEFRKNFRVTRRVHRYLVQKLGPYIGRQENNYNITITVEERVLIALTVLASNAELQLIANMFGLGKSTVQEIFHDFTTAVCNILRPIHIRVPDEFEFQMIEELFEANHRFPMVVGAIDGTHVEFECPKALKEDYFCYKRYCSVLTLAICDADTRVWWLKTGIPGRSNDAGAWNDSEIKVDFDEGRILPDIRRRIANLDVPYVILGDGAFGIKSYLLKPYAVHDDPRIVKYNEMHACARQTIERSFGIIKNRHRRIMYTVTFDLKNIPDIIETCFVLHNICLEFEGEFVPFVDEDGNIEEMIDVVTDEDDDSDDDDTINVQSTSAPTRRKPSGTAIRDAISRHFRP